MIKILVVDDDPDILFVVKRLLTQNDFAVTAISNGKDVIAVAATEEPDIILLDVNLGLYDGRQICQTLRKEKGLTIPILLFSANADNLVKAGEFGATGCIHKPFAIQELITTLRVHAHSN